MISQNRAENGELAREPLPRRPGLGTKNFQAVLGNSIQYFYQRSSESWTLRVANRRRRARP